MYASQGFRFQHSAKSSESAAASRAHSAETQASHSCHPALQGTPDELRREIKKEIKNEGQSSGPSSRAMSELPEYKPSESEGTAVGGGSDQETAVEGSQ